MTKNKKVTISKNYYNELIGRKNLKFDDDQTIELYETELENLQKIFDAFKAHGVGFGNVSVVEFDSGPELFSDLFKKTIH